MLIVYIFAFENIVRIKNLTITNMKKKKQQGKLSLTDYVKAARKGSREAEIEMYGHPINHRKVFKSKKVYDRKKMKASDKGLPLLFILFFF